MLHSSLMRCQCRVLFSKYLTAVYACLPSCPVPEQTASGLTNLLPAGGQHFSIFKALILNFSVCPALFRVWPCPYYSRSIWKCCLLMKIYVTPAFLGHFLERCPSTLKLVISNIRLWMTSSGKEGQSLSLQMSEWNLHFVTCCFSWSHVILSNLAKLKILLFTMEYFTVFRQVQAFERIYLQLMNAGSSHKFTVQ